MNTTKGFDAAQQAYENMMPEEAPECPDCGADLESEIKCSCGWEYEEPDWDLEREAKAEREHEHWCA